MTIWVDADACPKVIKDIIFRAAEKNAIPVFMVANKALKLPPSRWIKMLVVAHGFDKADDEIVSRIQAKDLVITSDIPLASEVLAKQAYVISPRGVEFTHDTIKQRLVMRDFMETLRASGIQSAGPSAISQKDRQVFGNKLDQILKNMS